MVDQSQRQDEVNLIEYWNILWNGKWIIIGLFILVVTATMLVNFQLPEYYKSETVIISTTSDAGGLGAALSSLPFGGMLGGAAGFQTAADKLLVILQSRTTAEAIVRRFDLIKVFNEKKWDAENNAWKDPARPPLLSEAVAKLTNSVTDFDKSKEGAISIVVEWTDPKLAADIANYYVFALTEFLKDKSMNITIQVVDKAIPAERKSRPKIRQNMMLAGIASSFMGVFVVFLLKYIERQRKRMNENR